MKRTDISRLQITLLTDTAKYSSKSTWLDSFFKLLKRSLISFCWKKKNKKTKRIKNRNLNLIAVENNNFFVSGHWNSPKLNFVNLSFCYSCASFRIHAICGGEIVFGPSTAFRRHLSHLNLHKWWKKDYSDGQKPSVRMAKQQKISLRNLNKRTTRQQRLSGSFFSLTLDKINSRWMKKKITNFFSPARQKTCKKVIKKVCKIEGRFWCIFILFYFKITRDFFFLCAWSL